MKNIVFKTLALVLCLAFVFMVTLPQAQAGWSWWKCAAGIVACGAAWAAAAKICAGPGVVACNVAISAAISICATVAANC